MTQTARRQFSLRDLLLIVLTAGAIFAAWRERAMRHQIVISEESKVNPDTHRVVLETARRLSAELDARKGKGVRLGHRLEFHEFSAKAFRSRIRVTGDLEAALPMDDPGYLRVDNPRMVYVRRIPATKPLTWAYRIYLPPDRLFTRRFQHGTVPKGSLPMLDVVHHSTAPFGRFTVTIGIDETPDGIDETPDGDGLLYITSGNGRSAQTLPAEALTRLTRLAREEPTPRNYNQRQLRPDEDIVLLRLMEPHGPGHETGVLVYFVPWIP